MANGRPGIWRSASLEWSMTDWWYSYAPWEKFMRTTLSPALRSILIFSTELVFGPQRASQQHGLNGRLGGEGASIPIVQMMDVRR